MTRKYFHPGRSVALIITLLALQACASLPPPTSAMAQAGDGVEAAQRSGAADHAPLELAAAQAKLAQAQAAMARNDYGPAADLAAESQVNSAVARAKSELADQREANQELNAENTKLRQKLLDASTSGADGSGGGA